MSRFFGSLCLGVAAVLVARDLGIPVWRDWNPGDCTDLGVLVFYGAWHLSRPVQRRG